MKNQNLEKAVNKYVNSLNRVIEKRKLWEETVRPAIQKTLNGIKDKFDLGWQIQELDWVLSNKSINLSFNAFPSSIVDRANCILNYEFVKGAALVFSQKYNGNIYVFILYPTLTEITNESDMKELGTYDPKDVDKGFITERVIDFLEEMTIWEGLNIRKKVGF